MQEDLYRPAEDLTGDPGCMDEKTEKIHEYVRSVLGQAGSHGLDHVERVTRLCEMIGAREHADMEILLPAALLHDIARPVEEERGTPHESEGARIAERFLRSIGYREDLIPPITHAIRTHRYRSKETPGTPEARILADADKLDAMGAVGIGRTFMRVGEQGGTVSDAVEHFHDKLLKLHDLMQTETARDIARERHTFLTGFLATLEREMALTTR
jgi:uncharacterized protein